MKKLRKDNKGFTLVELIVVLVILAILAAILVPALLGYIDEAKQKQLVLHGKSVYTAAQAAASQAYAKNEIPSSSSGKKTFGEKTFNVSDMDEFGAKKNVIAIIGFDGDGSTTTNHNNYAIAAIDYCEDGTWVQLKDGSWESGSGAANEKTNKVTITFDATKAVSTTNPDIK